MADIFISYASEDRSRVEPLAKGLEDLGWSVFWDRTIPAGKTWRQVIGDALETARSVIVAWSKTSVDSRWVQEEADRGLERNILIPILIDNVRPPLGFGTIQAADLISWEPTQSSPEFEKVIADISAILGPPPLEVEEAERAAKSEAQRKAKEEAERLEQERKNREARERAAKEEQARREREKREQAAKEEAARKAKEEAQRLEQERQDRKAHTRAAKKAERPADKERGPVGQDGDEKERGVPKDREAMDRRRSVLKLGGAAVALIILVFAGISLLRTKPTPSESQPSTVDTELARSTGVRSIGDLKVVTLDPPPFRNGKIGRGSATAQSFKLKLLSAKANEIIDYDAWFESNNLSLPVYEVPDPSRNKSGDLPKIIPPSYRGEMVKKAIRHSDRVLLVYGKDFSRANVLISFDPTLRTFDYGLDFKNYAYAPEYVREDKEYIYQGIDWAAQAGEVLYVSHSHSTYATSSKGMNAYVTAIDLKDYRILWRSQPLTSNAANFEIVGDYLITGYGFTAEPDFLYVLRQQTGEVVQKIKLKTAPDYIIRKGDKLYVRTYNTDYVFQILARG